MCRLDSSALTSIGNNAHWRIRTGYRFLLFLTRPLFVVKKFCFLPTQNISRSFGYSVEWISPFFFLPFRNLQNSISWTFVASRPSLVLNLSILYNHCTSRNLSRQSVDTCCAHAILKYQSLHTLYELVKVQLCLLSYLFVCTVTATLYIPSVVAVEMSLCILF